MIRAEQPGDSEAIHRVNAIAFGRANEADLVDQLRGLPHTLSLVAVAEHAIVGHIFFSPVTVAVTQAEDTLLLGLAPLAVLPAFQRQGLGSQLIRQGLTLSAQMGAKAVVVLGDPSYYGRFGFVPAQAKALTCEYTVPDGAFRVLELQPGALAGCQGLVRYRPEFAVCE
ncbi:MAG: N-acetyltransferase [Leptolyngbya sp. DLM2.Bin27]|nr:MAG: N-acetyltransferase [Leptolyngbya sp. DLM2.Bin27]